MDLDKKSTNTYPLPEIIASLRTIIYQHLVLWSIYGKNMMKYYWYLLST